ncbi:acetyl-CoA carboxylase biotin carboxyl carrier protein [Dorea acetigenes]|uniref:Biotin carboxyl carrier protein of acetyl-CoA carboxylase n=1 Tax=Dorea acetigenes TaxID=2981787 RepID=A0ABT2RLW9_9FIRM|nr:acetyl-CoA carboxylase biotin carboxyl carrier protein [Dorea acetigenes]MCB6415635.1 acetyl-CoA carboxylase biotin carboxyl carrier protein [Faecalimonas umbilicata]MCU6686414.1 acetyl-CoA carboxylase biotin carboxyl carrier protein [Dorea acetigenes]SCI93837.1 Biotin carboxyl carrier protein of acetyl-CoA carboxylase [uncultured Clostridium sp.]
MEFENLLTLMKTMSDSTLTELRYEEGGVKVKLAKQCGKSRAVESVLDTIVEKENIEETMDEEGQIVKSPLVGTFYAAPSEDAEPFAVVGSQVKKGQTLAIVEAMKLMNEIESDYDGTVAKVYVENGQAVEYGQPLFLIV